ncbi:MAG: FtsW/RodA/SpoVE family cell cycle protein [Bacillota bacterium]
MARTVPSRTRSLGGTRPPGGNEAAPAALAAPAHSPDGLLLFALAGLVSVGMIMVYSATAHAGGFDVARKMLFQFGMGGIGLVTGLLLPVGQWRKLAPLALIACALALGSLLVEANPLAITSGGATRWLGFGGFTVQPSEFAKLAFVLFAAHFLERRGPKMQLFRGYKFWTGFIAVFGTLAVLIAVEDLGTALVFGGTAFCVLWAAGADWKALIVGVAIAGLLVSGSVRARPHQAERIRSWENPWAYHQDEGFQVIQSWMALARGGWMGVGLGQSLQKLDNRLPEAETDFIFAVIAEELGLIRATGVILLFVLFAWRGYAIAARAPDRYTSLLATGVTSWISLQAGLNLGVVTGTIPNTGVPLPFISSGGSSLLALLMAVGILVAISRRTVLDQKEAIS